MNLLGLHPDIIRNSWVAEGKPVLSVNAAMNELTRRA